MGFRGSSLRTNPFGSTPTEYGGTPHSIGHVPSMLCAPMSWPIMAVIWACDIRPKGHAQASAAIVTTTAATKRAAFGLLNCRIRLTFTRSQSLSKLRVLPTSQRVKFTDADLKKVVKDGKKPMPAYGTKLNDQDIDSVTAYIRTLAGAPL